MSQEDIVKWLTKRRVETNNYFSVQEVEEGCDNITNCSRKLKQLHAYGFLDRKFKRSEGWGGLKPCYRLKKSKVLVKNLEGD